MNVNKSESENNSDKLRRSVEKNIGGQRSTVVSFGKRNRRMAFEGGNGTLNDGATFV